VRVMVEAESYEAANEVARRLADVVKASLAL
jgi:phosphomannomutase